jgi:amino acid permease
MTQSDMDSAETGFLSREELMGGLHAKRASTLLFAIEASTAQSVLQSRVTARFAGEKVAEAKERAFLNALSQGRDLPIQPTIQDLERHAGEWAPLVSPEPALRAVVAYLLSQKHIFTHATVPNLRKALSLDDEAVKQNFETRYGFPLADIYAPEISRFERLRWVWSGIAYRIDHLPPFWSVFAMTLTEAVGASILALPIALAGMGALAGILLVIGLGLVNILTIAALSESVVRNGNLRYGSAYFGRLITDFLGGAGYSVLIVTFLLLNVTVFIVYGVGVSKTLADITGVPAFIWPLPLFLIDFYFLIRQSYSATIASNLVIGGFNLVLILLMALLAFPHLRPENLFAVNLPGLGGRSFDPASLSLVFGVVLWTYFGYTSPVGSARQALRGDPSGRSLIWGAIAAVVVAIAFNVVWLIGVSGTITPATLAAETGTGLTPLAEQAGPLINVFGLIFVVLSMGMGMISYSLSIFSQVDEWLSEWHPKESPAGTSLSAWARQVSSTSTGRFVIGVAPVVILFVVTALLLLTGQESFAGPLSFLGTLAVPLLVGIFPVLLLAAGRQKGEYVPAAFFEWLGNPVVLVILYVLFLATIFIHGLVIWQDPFQRFAAVIAGIIILGMTFLVMRRGAFTPRAVLEVRVEQTPQEEATFTLTSSGKPMPADVQLHYQDGEKALHTSGAELENFSLLRSATFELPLHRARELKVWLHVVTRQGHSQRLFAHVQVRNGTATRQVAVDDLDSPMLFPLDPSNASLCQVQIAFS